MSKTQQFTQRQVDQLVQRSLKQAGVQQSAKSTTTGRQQQPQRRNKVAPTPRWATEHNVQVAAKHTPRPRAAPTEEQSVSMREQRRRQLVRDRSRTRRIPWQIALGVAVGAVAGWGLTAAFAAIGAPALIVAAVLSALPPLVAFTVALGLRERLGSWWRDLTAAALAASGLVFWLAYLGPSWLAVGVWLVATIACAARWWAAHPVGPDVPALQPPEPAAPESIAPAPALAPVDEYVLAWDRHISGPRGKLPGSRLTNRQEGEFTVTYDVELERGQHTYHTLQANAAAIASGLGLDRDRLVPEKAARGQGEHRAKLTLVTTDPVAENRYYTGPQVTDGVIRGLGCHVDGRGEVEVTMWTRAGMVPTMIVGSTGSGKSAGANTTTCGAMSTGLLNLLYIDPKGNSSSAMRDHARVAILGKDNASKASELVLAMAQARGALGRDMLLPSPELPGWEVLHDEFSFVVGDTKTARRWAQISNTVRAVGMWLIAMNQALQESKWCDDHTRSAFASQVIAFRINSSSDDLVEGLEYRPHDLPVDDNNAPISGMAVKVGYGRSNVPGRWDWLPSDHDEVDTEPPLRTTTAFEYYFDQPDVADVDYQVLVSFLGEPVNGRWIVGGPNATHAFRDDTTPSNTVGASAAAASATTRPAPTGFGLTATATPALDPSSLLETDRGVLAAMEDGHSRVADIKDSCGFPHRTVYDSLNRLGNTGWITSPKRGVWHLTPTATSVLIPT